MRRQEILNKKLQKRKFLTLLSSIMRSTRKLFVHTFALERT